MALAPLRKELINDPLRRQLVVLPVGRFSRSIMFIHVNFQQECFPSPVYTLDPGRTKLDPRVPQKFETLSDIF